MSTFPANIIAKITNPFYSSRSRQLFETRLGEALAHNSQEPKPSYLKGINEFSDVEAPPMGRKVTPGLKAKNNAGTYKPQMKFDDLPTEVDWREAGVVSPVKNQGGCGSCYAFATTATVESHIALETGLLFDLSPQQVRRGEELRGRSPVRSEATSVTNILN